MKRLLLALTLPLAALGCSESPTEPPASIAGSYRLSSISDRPLPRWVGPTLIRSGALELGEGWSYTLDVAYSARWLGHEDAAIDSVIPATLSASGAEWTQTDSTAVLIGADTLTASLDGPGLALGLRGAVMRFVRD